jgi:hypothetical protein
MVLDIEDMPVTAGVGQEVGEKVCGLQWRDGVRMHNRRRVIR